MEGNGVSIMQVDSGAMEMGWTTRMKELALACSYSGVGFPSLHQGSSDAVCFSVTLFATFPLSSFSRIPV